MINAAPTELPSPNQILCFLTKQLSITPFRITKHHYVTSLAARTAPANRIQKQDTMDGDGTGRDPAARENKQTETAAETGDRGYPNRELSLTDSKTRFTLHYYK
jgi:hypothetical protein